MFVSQMYSMCTVCLRHTDTCLSKQTSIRFQDTRYVCCGKVEPSLYQLPILGGIMQTVQTQNAASDLGLHYLLIRTSIAAMHGSHSLVRFGD